MPKAGFDPAALSREVLDEHRALRELIAEIETVVCASSPVEPAGWLGAVADRLLDLEARLAAHFAVEEIGLFDQIQEAAPDSAPACSRLLAQHGEFLHRLGQLREEAQTGKLGVGAAEFTGRVSALFRDLERHEVRENELLIEVLEGSGGAPD